jgi:hypothetical protein
MGLHLELASLEQALAGEAQTPVQRLERLQAQMEALNGVLKEIVDKRNALARKRRHAHRRPASAVAQHMRFRRQAKRLARYAPY